MESQEIRDAVIKISSVGASEIWNNWEEIYTFKPRVK
jgi:hypothetical protein